MYRRTVYLLCIASTVILAGAVSADSHGGTCEQDADCPVGEICSAGGECTPGTCLNVWQPVCAADGQTYSNRCYARLAHVEVVHEGECGQTCGGITGQKCPKSQFCLHQLGTCDVPDNIGVCTDFPQICSTLYKPVCGCDGKTYSNDCFSRQAGVSISHQGACEGRGGEVCKSTSDCNRNESCQFRAPSCGDGVTGVCVPKPETCTEDYNPECGCDGTTYANACYRIMAGASLLHKGECRQSCGGFVGPLCPEGDVCDLLPGNCNTPEAPGECVPRPGVCPDVWDPVCACDGETYGNDCERLQAGVAKAHHGTCSGTTVTGRVSRNCYGDCLADCRDDYLDCVDDCRENEPGDQECMDDCSQWRDECDDDCLEECSR